MWLCYMTLSAFTVVKHTYQGNYLKKNNDKTLDFILIGLKWMLSIMLPSQSPNSQSNYMSKPTCHRIK